jgi:hypothetical protein
MEQQDDRIMDGDLQTLGLQSVLKMLALSEKTGTLFVTSGPETLSINLRKGRIVGLQDEGFPQPDMLAMLALIGRLDPRRVQALQLQQQAGYSMQMALAKLVELNWMSAAEMQQRLEFAVTQSISHALRWANGRFAFHRQMLTMDTRLQSLDIDSVLLEALRQADEWEKMGDSYLTRTTTVRWLQEVQKDVRSLGLDREAIAVLCLANGEIPLQAMALALMMPEARVARLIAHLLEFRLIEVVNTALEGELQRDLSNLIIKYQAALAKKQQITRPEQRLLGLAEILSECINALFVHHSRYAKGLRGRGELSPGEISRFLEGKFLPQFQLLAKPYPILETAEFSRGQLDCSSILTLQELVRGEQLEEFYWQAAQGLAAYLRMVLSEVLREECGNSLTGYNLNVVWKSFLSEVDNEMQQYQLYRAQRNVQTARSGNTAHLTAALPPLNAGQQRGEIPQVDMGTYWLRGTQSR